MATTTQKSGLTFKHKVGYAMGDLGGCMTFALMGAMVTRYYTNVLQVNTAVLATLLLVWNIWDAVNDPMMGALMDKMYAKHHNKNGKFRPWLLRAAPLLAITSIVFWTVPTLFDGYTMLVVLFFCKILYEGCYTMFNIPMGSLLSAMANTDGERAALSSARGFGSMIGNVIPMAPPSARPSASCSASCTITGQRSAMSRIRPKKKPPMSNLPISFPFSKRTARFLRFASTAYVSAACSM